MFEKCYEPLCKDLCNSGQIALLPWDTETFGFGVADYEFDDTKLNTQQLTQLGQCFEAWAKAHLVELIGTTVSAMNSSALYFLQSLGFRYIDTILMLRYEDVQNATWQPAKKVMLTEANQNDLPAVIQICGKAFENGRYHADPRFPRHLANQRYQDWARRSFDSENPQTILAARINDAVCAFSIVRIDGKEGCIELNAVSPQWQGKKVGLSLIASTMRYFQHKGVSLVLSKISAANMAAMNLHAFFGARFYDPRILLHWHAPWASHLEADMK